MGYNNTLPDLAWYVLRALASCPVQEGRTQANKQERVPVKGLKEPHLT